MQKNALRRSLYDCLVKAVRNSNGVQCRTQNRSQEIFGRSRAIGVPEKNKVRLGVGSFKLAVDHSTSPSFQAVNSW